MVEKCTVCDTVLPARTLRAGRPPTYCSIRCRRVAELRQRRAARVRALAALHRAGGDAGRATLAETRAARVAAGVADDGAAGLDDLVAWHAPDDGRLDLP